jgi:hypothetical protein
MLPPVTQRRIRPGQSEKKKYGASGFVEDLPNRAPERAEKAARPGGYRGGAFHAVILTQKPVSEALLDHTRRTQDLFRHA